MSHIKIAPSIIAADFAHLEQQVRAAEAGGADWIHVDVMDGIFVPNITIGPFVLATLRSLTDLPLDVHLMITEPERFIDDFIQAGADSITVHVEATHHLHRVVNNIKETGKKAGVALNPGTSLTTLEAILPMLDLALIMSVNPGFSGQSYIPTSTNRIRQVRHLLNDYNPHAELEVDGGVKPTNAGEAVAAGATVLVAASAVFGKGASVEDNIGKLKAAVS